MEEGVTVVSLAKRLEEIYVPGRGRPIVLPRDSRALQLLQRHPRRGAPVRDRAPPRCAATSSMKASVLDELPGIGPARKRALLRHFGSPERFLGATREELEAVPGLPGKVARQIHEQLNKTGSSCDERWLGAERDASCASARMNASTTSSRTACRRCGAAPASPPRGSARGGAAARWSSPRTRPRRTRMRASSGIDAVREAEREARPSDTLVVREHPLPDVAQARVGEDARADLGVAANLGPLLVAERARACSAACSRRRCCRRRAAGPASRTLLDRRSGQAQLARDHLREPRDRLRVARGAARRGCRARRRAPAPSRAARCARRCGRSPASARRRPPCCRSRCGRGPAPWPRRARRRRRRADSWRVVAVLRKARHAEADRHLHGVVGELVAQSRCRSRSASMNERWSAVSGTISANSSPPSRARVSMRRFSRSRISLARASARSPSWWPNRSLTCLKWSRSPISDAQLRARRGGPARAPARRPPRTRAGSAGPVRASVRAASASPPTVRSTWRRRAKISTHATSSAPSVSSHSSGACVGRVRRASERRRRSRRPRAPPARASRARLRK